MRPETRAWLWDAREACAAVTSFVDGLALETYADDLRTRSAVERQLEILGESLKRVRQHDPEVAVLVPDIANIIGMRNLLAHEYGVVDDRLVWDAAVHGVPGVLKALQALLNEPPLTA
ncbi:MAG: DUF86 domain-containing protein [Actinomyces sp.]|uniref:HepT-like ribonuclease domain-containing protein n=1 Tax=Actinomyces sp. TaxID=29317 RepID=UPI0026DC3E9A|nr:HepT-like ribonuclease domain-containing protein [Actinomyces sp.]MDO4242341.1 DUF86 domain-containing protein [Actinomyces sp.]